ncbi:hypothetical protein GCM10023353_38560 [Tomitella cavernea]|uniref:Lipoprotein n=2 Tax=Tomitella cavernea TaxID=1387982 RepID=A0ABP9D3Z1_9ACTN
MPVPAVAVLVLLTLVLAAGCAPAGETGAGNTGPARTPGSATAPQAPPVAADPPGRPTAASELPGGGTQFFPGRRLVALYGHPGAPNLGALGEQGPDAAIARAQDLAARYAPLSDVPVVPALEIIATLAQDAPGPDGDFSAPMDPQQLHEWVDKARAAGVYVVLDLQPGRADLLDQARRYADLLREPNVGLAIDPEWKLQPGQAPLQQIGHVASAEVNAVGAWLDGLTGDNEPQTLLVVHQFQTQMVRGEDTLRVSWPHVQTLVHMDGQGTPGVKEDTWHAIVGAVPEAMPMGWKNFLHIDTPMLTAAQTMAHRPQPLMISYQ